MKLTSVPGLLPAAILLIMLAFSGVRVISAQVTPNIQAPRLTNTVRLDGKISGTGEWSDAPGTNLTLSCKGYPCGITPLPSRTEATIWMKHDGTWLYSLVRVSWPNSVKDYQRDAIRIDYYWTPELGFPLPNGQWEYTDASFVGPGEAGGRPWTGDNWNVNGTEKADEDWVPPGRNDVQGYATHDGANYWFELRKPLNSGDGHDWNFIVGRTYGVPGADGQLRVAFGSSHTTSGSRLYYYQYVTLGIIDSRTLVTSITTASPTTSSATTGSSIRTSFTTPFSSSSQTTVAPSLIVSPFGNIGLVGLVAAVVLVSSVLVLRNRRRPAHGTVILKGAEGSMTENKPLTEEPAEKGTLRDPGLESKPLEQVAQIITSPVQDRKVPTKAESIISTGYAELDTLLSGGLPEGYAVLFASPSYDERDLLLRKIVEANLSSNTPVFYISADLRRTKDLLDRYPENFYAFCQQADKISAASRKPYQIGGVENLSEFNISLTLAMRSIQVEQGARRIMIVDAISDVLLRHKMLTTRRWLSDFLAKRKAEGFTILATFNPLISAKEEAQAVFDSFDGVVEIYEKELKERSRRFLTIKKMYGRKYSESELMLDKDKLF